jgi:glutathione synthase/RimK-type ligase-like ATP-grasp enzyme/ribosomal protein S18 acetylase RimI-like enzyme
MYINIRKSTENDLEFIENVERTCFPVFQQSSRRMLQKSITSNAQEVWIAEDTREGTVKQAGTLILHIRTRTLRIYSIGVLPEFQGTGIGQKLLTHACNQAIARGFEKISLEARSKDEKLVNWYLKTGFVITGELKDYYTKGEHAVRMRFTVSRPKRKDPISNIIVVDDPGKWRLSIEDVRVISAKSYLSDGEFQTASNLRVFNLSNSYRYQSTGYYVSLLASAREHRAIPSVATIRDFRNLSVIRAIANDIDELMQKSLEKKTDTKFNLNIYFGQTVDPAFRNLGHKLYLLFETPLLKVQFSKTDRWLVQKVRPLSLDKIDEADMIKIGQFASSYFARKRFQKPRLKHYKYNLAILINPNEPNPPSCPSALRNFKNVANNIGFYVDYITKDDYESLGEYDALFIRETTNVNDHTYEFARRAYAEGLVVIDDPWSILRCSNKIYLNERMKQNRIETPKTEVLVKSAFKKSLLSKFKYPLVLKQPDSAFSLGVIKVTNQEEMLVSVEKLFRKSELIVAQEFLPSEFDWRIGILDQTPLFACKYYMAKDHWQILNWNKTNDEIYGNSETVALNKVPEHVIKVAVKSAGLMGDGLYGVDLKEINGKVFLVEVNDNPNIDAGIEDAVLGEELYLRIMKSLYNRIEVSRNMARFVAMET